MKKVLIIGAGFLQRFVIRRAKELGYYTLTVDADPQAVGFADADEYRVISIVDEEACLAYAHEKQVDGVLTAATDYGVLTVAHIAEEMGLNGISYAAAKRIKNKFQIRRRLFEAGADDTPLACEIGSDEDIAQARDRVAFPVMVKPCDGSGSRGASRVDDPSDFAAACRNAMANSLTRKATVEPFIVGEEYGVESFVRDGEVHILAVMKKAMTQPPYYAELGHKVPSELPAELESKVRRCVTVAIQALELTFGSVNMDLLLTADGQVHIVDIGARMGGNLIGSHIVPLSSGVDYMANMVRAAAGDATDFTPHESLTPVATRLLALTPGTVVSLPNFEALAAEYNVVIEHHLCVGDTIREYHTNLDGCGYVVATGVNAEATAETVKNRIDREIVRN